MTERIRGDPARSPGVDPLPIGVVDVAGLRFHCSVRPFQWRKASVRITHNSAAVQGPRFAGVTFRRPWEAPQLRQFLVSHVKGAPTCLLQYQNRHHITGSAESGTIR